MTGLRSCASAHGWRWRRQRRRAAQENAIESITANQQGAERGGQHRDEERAGQAADRFFDHQSGRIALDFGATANATGKSSQEVNLGDLRSMNVVQAGERTRLVLNLKRPLNYATAIDGKSVIVTVEGSGGVAQAVDRAGVPVAAPAEPPHRRPARRCATSISAAAPNGEGRVVVDLPNSQVGGRRAPARQQGAGRLHQDRPA